MPTADACLARIRELAVQRDFRGIGALIDPEKKQTHVRLIFLLAMKRARDGDGLVDFMKNARALGVNTDIVKGTPSEEALHKLLAEADLDALFALCIETIGRHGRLPGSLKYDAIKPQPVAVSGDTGTVTFEETIPGGSRRSSICFQKRAGGWYLALFESPSTAGSPSPAPNEASLALSALEERLLKARTLRIRSKGVLSAAGVKAEVISEALLTQDKFRIACSNGEKVVTVVASDGAMLYREGPRRPPSWQPVAAGMQRAVRTFLVRSDALMAANAVCEQDWEMVVLENTLEFRDVASAAGERLDGRECSLYTYKLGLHLGASLGNIRLWNDISTGLPLRRYRAGDGDYDETFTELSIDPALPDELFTLPRQK